MVPGQKVLIHSARKGYYSTRYTPDDLPEDWQDDLLRVVTVDNTTNVAMVLHEATGKLIGELPQKHLMTL